MPQLSAGLLMCRMQDNRPQFFLVHPGGPFYAKKDLGAWSIPKGLCDPGEDQLTSAKREFFEETGITPSGDFRPIGNVTLAGGKIIHAWWFFGQWNEADGITSNTFSLQWPPRSGKFIEIPEADRAGWFDFDDASKRIHSRQQPFLTRALEMISDRPTTV